MIAQETTYRVSATALNLRSSPDVSPGTRIGTLPNGHEVEIVGSADEPGWVMVTTDLDGTSITGFVAERFLTPSNEFDDPDGIRGVQEVHLRENREQARRDADGQRAFPIGERDRPTRDPSAERQKRLDALTRIVEWLDVENSARYIAGGGRTFCNIYAHDYCYLAGVYLPRVWWRDRALMRLESGEAVQPVYDQTLRELNANSLFEWLREWGPEFQWEHVFSLDDLQDRANNGSVGVIVAQRTELNRPGHITVVVPETDRNQAVREEDRVVHPLQSQAGTNNFSYGTTHWWTHERFRDSAFWTAP